MGCVTTDTPDPGDAMNPFPTLNPMMMVPQVPVMVAIPVAVPVAVPVPVPVVARRVPQQPPVAQRPQPKPTAMETVAKVAGVVGQIFDFAKKHLSAGTTPTPPRTRPHQPEYTAQPEMLPDSAFGEPDGYGIQTEQPQAWGGGGGDWGADVPTPEAPMVPEWDMGIGGMGEMMPGYDPNTMGYDPNIMAGGFDPNAMMMGYDPNGGW